jgi:hypothetical protein
VEIREKNQVKSSKRFAALENLDYGDGGGGGGDDYDYYDYVDINRSWESIKENINTSVTERLCHFKLKLHKPRFDEECQKLLDMQ